MEKTKFGVSVALLSMLCYFTGYFSFTSCVILFAVIMACSESVAAKKNASQALVLSVLFSLVSTVLGWLSGTYLDLVGTISSFCIEHFSWYNASEILSAFDIMGFLNKIWGLLEIVLMIIFVIKSFKGKDIKIPIVTKIVNKHFGEEENAEEV